MSPTSTKILNESPLYITYYRNENEVRIEPFNIKISYLRKLFLFFFRIKLQKLLNEEEKL